MNYIEINESQRACEDRSIKTKILIFTEGTIIGPRNVFQHFSHAAYVPIGASNEKISDWYKQGAEIIYLTSKKRKEQVTVIAEILERNHFGPGILMFMAE